MAITHPGIIRSKDTYSRGTKFVSDTPGTSLLAAMKVDAVTIVDLMKYDETTDKMTMLKPINGLGTQFNIKDGTYASGAKGDGLVNDTAAFQAALNAAGVLVAHTAWQSRTTANVHIPPGDYLITSTLAVPAGVGITGSGYSSRIKASGCDAFSFAAGGATTQVAPVVIENFWIDGLNCENYSAFVSAGTQSLADRVYGLKFGGLYVAYFGRGFFLRTVWQSTIRDCTLEAVPVGCVIAGQSTEILIRDCHWHDARNFTGGFGTHLGLNVIESAYAGVNYRPEDVSIFGTTIISYDIGINWQQCLLGSIRDNTLDYCDVAGISYLQSDGGLTIEGNWIALTDRVGASPLYGIQGQVYTGTNTGTVSIRNNWINYLQTPAAGDCGIYLKDNQDNAVIDNNTISGFTSASGFDIRCLNNKASHIVDNKCRRTGGLQSIDITTPTGPHLYGDNYCVNVTNGGFYALPVAGTTPSVLFGTNFRTVNIGATSITNFIDGKEGQRITVMLDSFTTLVNSGTLNLWGGVNYVGATNATITLVSRAGNWYEIARAGGALSGTSAAFSGAVSTGALAATTINASSTILQKSASMSNNILIGPLSNFPSYGSLSFNNATGSTAILGFYADFATNNDLWYNLPAGGTHRFAIGGTAYFTVASGATYANNFSVAGGFTVTAGGFAVNAGVSALQALTATTIQTSGNVGVGTNPANFATTTGYGKQNIGGGGLLISGITIAAANPFLMLANADLGASSYTYVANDLASRYYQLSGVHYWSTAVSGTAGAALTWVQAMSLSATGLSVPGSVLSPHATAGMGYSTGAGGTVTQATSKTTGVTLNTVCGQITMNAASLAASTIVSFVLTDSAIALTDLLVINHISGGTLGAYTVTWTPAAGSATIYVRNNTAGALAEAIVLGFALHKAVTS